MRKIFLLLLPVSLITAFSSCEKCYQCHNYCKVCHEVHTDTTLTIVVKSDVLTETYFNEYIDSLNSLGWTCADTSSTKTESFCGSNAQNSGQLLTREDNGWICAPSQ